MPGTPAGLWTTTVGARRWTRTVCVGAGRRLALADEPRARWPSALGTGISAGWLGTRAHTGVGSRLSDCVRAVGPRKDPRVRASISSLGRARCPAGSPGPPAGRSRVTVSLWALQPGLLSRPVGRVRPSLNRCAGLDAVRPQGPRQPGLDSDVFKICPLHPLCGSGHHGHADSDRTQPRDG